MKIIQIAIKDLKHTFQNVFSLVMMLGAPLLVTGLLFFAFGSLDGEGGFQLPATEVLVVNQDRGSGQKSGFDASELLMNFLADEEIGSVLEFNQGQEAGQARESVEQGEVGVALIIPDNFTAAALQPGEQTAVTLYQDPTLNIAPGILEDLLIHFMDGFSGAKIAASVAKQQLTNRGIDISQQEMGLVSAQYADWMETAGHSEQNGNPAGIALVNISSVPAAENPAAELVGPIMSGMMIFFVFFMAANGTQTIIQEAEKGTLARLVTTPTPPSQILAGKFLGVFLTVVAQVVLLLTSSNFLFGIRWGRPVTVAVVSLAMLVAATGFGVLVISFIKNTRQTGPVLGGLLTLTGMLGGLFTNGIPNLPPFFNRARLVMPQGWAMTAWEITLGGGKLQEVIVPVVVLLMLGGIFFSLGTWIFQRRFV